MVMNPLTMLNPEQVKMLEEVQKFTKDIKAVIKKEGDSGFTVILNTDNDQAKQYLPQIRESMINSLAQTLYTFFNITGKVEG